jgi:hypothetical protein
MRHKVINAITPRFCLLIVTIIMLVSCGTTSVEKRKDVQKSTVVQNGYKTFNPQPLAGIDRAYVAQLVEVLAADAIDDKTKDSCVLYAWNAFTNPVQFDMQFTYFSTQCLRLLANGKLDEEVKPFLAEWSNCTTDLQYLQFVLDRVLTYYHCKSYGDDTDGVGAALYQIKQTRFIALPKYEPNENALEYMRRLNKTVLQKHHKVALMQKDYPGIYVCDAANVEALKALARKINLQLVEP